MHFEGKNHLRKNVSANMRRKILDENLMENNSQMANFEMTLFQCSVLLHWNQLWSQRSTTTVAVLWSQEHCIANVL